MRAIGNTTDRPLLLLFDIDGTLLRGATEAQAAALHRALTDVFGITESDATEIETAGRTDLEIARELAVHHAVTTEQFDAQRDELAASWCALHAELCAPDLTHTALTGASELLGALGQDERFTLSLVTGNLEPIARLKLERVGFGGYFAAGQGGFGSDSEQRTELPPLARARAGEWPRERTVLIGDTPLDIACARADEIECVAIAGGIYSVAELAGADRVLENISDLADLLLK